MAQREGSGGRIGFLVGLLIAVSVLLIGGLIVALAVLANRNSSSTAAPPPYGIDLRILPTTNNPADLMPASVGGFTRRSLDGSLSNGVTGQVTSAYVRGSDTVMIHAIRDANVAQAQADVQAQALDSNLPHKTIVPSESFSYFMATDSKNGSVRYVVAASYWVFDVTASSQAALDTFMKAFPY